MAGDVKERVRRRIGEARGELVALSRRIHGAPELAFEEERACAWLCEALAGVGFAVEAGAYGLPTAFTARAGSGPLRLVVCAEYDALPGVGHACGHNLIAAMAVGQTGIGLLRQHLRPSDQVHGIVTKGGDAPNIVPAQTSARYMVRAATLEELAGVRAKVLRCFEAGALATGASLEVVAEGSPYAEMRHDPDLLVAYRRNAEALGRRLLDDQDGRRVPMSTDMGNVSRALPAIHPSISIDSLPAVNHQREFTAHCVSPAAEQALLDGAVVVASSAASRRSSCSPMRDSEQPELLGVRRLPGRAGLVFGRSGGLGRRGALG